MSVVCRRWCVVAGEQNLSAAPGCRSFLHAEMDEFERVLSELTLSASRSSPPPPPRALGPASRWASFDRVVDDFHREAGLSGPGRHDSSSPREKGSPHRTGGQSGAEARLSPAGRPFSPLATIPDTDDDKLFSDLLDDIDNINPAASRQRQKARDLFSDWLFSGDRRVSLNDRPMLRRAGAGAGASRQKSKRRSADFSDAARRRDPAAPARRRRPRSMEVQSDVVRTLHSSLNTLPSAFSPADCQYTCHHKCRPLISVDCESPDRHQVAAAGGGGEASDGQDKARAVRLLNPSALSNESLQELAF